MQKDLYFVAVKVFLTDKAGRLLITRDKFGSWDLPGGRLRPQDFKTPLAQVVKRKITEELGRSVKYKLGNPAVFMRHERMERRPTGRKAKRRIFAVGYKARYLGGNIRLGKNHFKHLWVERRGFKPAKYFAGGWLTGVREYLRQMHAH